MDDSLHEGMTLEQKIFLWKALPHSNVDNTDIFITQLVERVGQLESEVEELGYEILEMGERE